MPRRIIPILCALAVAVVPASALAQPAQDPSPPATHPGIVYGDTKYDLQNQKDQGSATGGTAYERAISGDTKGNLPRAIVPAPPAQSTPVASRPTTQPTASTDDGTNGWQIAAIAEAALLAAFALGAAAYMASRQHRAPRMGV